MLPDIICFASEDWNHNRLSKKHLLTRLAKHTRVLFIESVGIRKPRATSHDLTRVIRRLRLALSGPRVVHHNLYIYAPVAMPFHAHKLASLVNRRLLTWQVRCLMRRLRIQRPILWVGIPTAWGVVGNLSESLVIYHCADRFTAYLDNEYLEAIGRMDQWMLAHADLVLTPSQDTADEVRSTNRYVFLIPHGVDHSHFAKAQDPSLPVARAIAAVPHPVIGYFGLIDTQWVDSGLLEYTARKRPGWHLAMVGPVNNFDIDSLLRFPNIHWFGQQDYKDLPSFARAFDVGIVPFRVYELTRTARPLKIREYLAAGLPVISTVSPEPGLRSVVRHASDYERFVAAVEEEMAFNSPAAVARRQSTVIDDSWDKRAKQVMHLIESGLARRCNG